MTALTFFSSLAGVLVLVALNRLLGGWTPVRLDTPDEALERFAQAHPDFMAATVLLAPDGTAALLTRRDSAGVGLLVACAGALVSRELYPGDLRAMTRRARGLRLTTSDFTWPRIDIDLPAPDRAIWSDLLRPLLASPLDDAIGA